MSEHRRLKPLRKRQTAAQAERRESSLWRRGYPGRPEVLTQEKDRWPAGWKSLTISELFDR